MISKQRIAKIAAQIVVTTSVSKVIHDVIEENTDAESKTDQVQLWVGSYVLSNMVCHTAWDYFEDNVIRSAAEFVNGFKEGKNASE